MKRHATGLQLSVEKFAYFSKLRSVHIIVIWLVVLWGSTTAAPVSVRVASVTAAAVRFLGLTFSQGLLRLADLPLGGLVSPFIGAPALAVRRELHYIRMCLPQPL